MNEQGIKEIRKIKVTFMVKWRQGNCDRKLNRVRRIMNWYIRKNSK